MNCILLRYGEVGTKSWRKRPIFERHYIVAIKDALDRNGFKDYKVDNQGGRFIIFSKDAEKMISVLKKVPGIMSLSEAEFFNFKNKEEIILKAEKIYKKLLENKTFKVSCRRIGKHDFGSMQIAGEIGHQLGQYSEGVKMTNPDLTINVEIRNDKCYLFTNSHKGIGGLPSKSAGNVLCLFSGGIDSPVAAFNALKRGFETHFLYINLLGEKGTYQTAQVYNYLISQYAYGFKPRFYEVNGLNIVKKIQKEVESKYRQIAIKIAFYKIAEAVAKINHHTAIVTGEALSQKSSQTVESLTVIQSQSEMLFIRPLVCMDKDDIVKIAREIGTMEYSKTVKEYCNLAKGPVSTMPSMAVLNQIPSFEKEVEECIKTFRVHKGFCDVENDEEPDVKDFKKSLVIDITSRFVKEKIKSDLKGSYPEIINKKIEKENSYIIVCDFGVKAENFAAHLRKKNIKAVGMSLKQFENFNKN